MVADDGLHPEARLGRRKPSVVWLAPAVFMEFFCLMGPTGFFQEDVKNLYGAAAVSIFTSAIGLRGLLSFITSPGIGALSDHWGRKPLLGVQVLGITAQLLPLAIKPGHTWSVNAGIVLLAMNGLTGGQFGSAFAYCSDLAPPGEANKVQALIARMLALSFAPSFVLAPAICKFVFKFFGEQMAWSLLVGLGVANTLYIFILLPESLNSFEHNLTPGEERRILSPEERPPRLSRNPLRYFRLLGSRSPAGSESARFLRIISGIIFFLYVAKYTLLSVVVLYAEERFFWHPGNAGLLISIWGFVQFLSMTAVGMCEKALDEHKISWIGLIAGLFGILICFFTVQGWMLCLGMAIGAISMITLTALTSYAGCLVNKAMHGEVQGLTTTMVCLTETFGPPIFGTVMSYALKQRGAPWWFVNLPFGGGVLCVVAAMLLMRRLPRISQARHLCSRILDQSTLAQDQFETRGTSTNLPAK